ncbi:GTPase, partial [Candidatus Riflebacteria bacterium]
MNPAYGSGRAEELLSLFQKNRKMLTEIRLTDVYEKVITGLNRLNQPLIIGLFGGTGVGKSTLINRLTGLEVSNIGMLRPTTLLPVAYTYSETEIEFPFELHKKAHNNREHNRFILIDTPDVDSISEANLKYAKETLDFCDICLLVVTREKYNSMAYLEFIKKIHFPEVSILCTHADELQSKDSKEAIKTHLLECFQHLKLEKIFFSDLTVTEDKFTTLSGESLPNDFLHLKDFLIENWNKKNDDELSREKWRLFFPLIDNFCNLLGKKCEEKKVEFKRLENRKEQTLTELNKIKENFLEKIVNTFDIKFRKEIYSYLLKHVWGMGSIFFRLPMFNPFSLLPGLPFSNTGWKITGNVWEQLSQFYSNEINELKNKFRIRLEDLTILHDFPEKICSSTITPQKVSDFEIKGLYEQWLIKKGFLPRFFVWVFLFLILLLLLAGTTILLHPTFFNWTWLAIFIFSFISLFIIKELVNNHIYDTCGIIFNGQLQVNLLEELSFIDNFTERVQKFSLAEKEQLEKLEKLKMDFRE